MKKKIKRAQNGHTLKEVEKFIAKKNAPDPEKDDHGKSQARVQIDSIVEMVAALDLAGNNDESREAAETRINEDPLSVEVRSDWYTLNKGANTKPSEYNILLCTGGPAFRIIGDLGKYGEPETAVAQYQDWGTQWTEYRETTDEEDAALLRYAQCFYFGE